MDNIPFLEDDSVHEKLLSALLEPIANEVVEQKLYLKKSLRQALLMNTTLGNQLLTYGILRPKKSY